MHIFLNMRMKLDVEFIKLFFRELADLSLVILMIFSSVGFVAASALAGFGATYLWLSSTI